MRGTADAHHNSCNSKHTASHGFMHSRPVLLVLPAPLPALTWRYRMVTLLATWLAPISDTRSHPVRPAPTTTTCLSRAKSTEAASLEWIARPSNLSKP